MPHLITPNLPKRPTANWALATEPAGETPYPFSPGSSQKVAIVLGAGGPAGHAFHAGILLGLQERFAWEPREADYLVGTSAGAQVAALLRGGMSAADLAARVVGTPLTESGVILSQHFVRPEYSRALVTAQVRKKMAAPRLGLNLLRGQIGIGLAGLLPEGYVDLSPQAARLRAYFGTDWPERSLWINAVSLRTGRRVVFGHPDGPSTDVGTAVACSGAIPAVCRPIEIGSERYVDGGFFSFMNLDLVENLAVDWVVVSSPLSRYPPIRWRTRRLVRRLRSKGTRVLFFEPDLATRRAIGRSMMDLARAPAVCLAAATQVRAQFAHPSARHALAE